MENTKRYLLCDWLAAISNESVEKEVGNAAIQISE